jgi:FtsH-binding integral membrane protein
MALANARPIPGAVATQGVNERVAFLRRVYGHLGLAILAFVGATYGFMHFLPEQALAFTAWALGGRLNWFIVLGLFMATGYIAEKMARSDTSRNIQYLGLALGVVAYAIIITPILFIAAYLMKDPYLIQKAGLITLVIFAGLTGTVFLTRKDFSFMRGALMIGSFAALGLIGASLLFGFQLGTLFCVAMIVLMAGYVLYQTSLVMAYFRPTQHVAAALMLFGTIATLFFYVLQLLMSLNSRR